MHEPWKKWIMRSGPFLALALLLGTASAQQKVVGPSEFFQMLQNDVGVSDDDLSTIEAGREFATVLPVHTKGEVAVAGVERIRVPLKFFLNAFTAMPTLKRGHQVLQIRDFSSPPREQDLQTLVLTPQDIQALLRCIPGNCDVKLSAAMMDHFHGQGLRAATLDDDFRKVILEYLNRYLKVGNAAMITYDDKIPPIRSLGEFLGLLHETGWLNQTAPPLYNCLASFSGAACPQIDSFVYWSNALFGLKPVFSVTQTMIDQTVRAGHPWVFVGFKQLYADHYFDGAFGLAVLVEQSADSAHPVLWVLYINRTHTDALSGWLGPIKRAIAERRSRGAMQKTLLDLKASLERKYWLSREPSAK
jgi:hypothetical protein